MKLLPKQHSRISVEGQPPLNEDSYHLPSLKTDENTLRKMAPESLLRQLYSRENFLALIDSNEDNELIFYYSERNAPDPYRNWERYDEWKRNNIQEGVDVRPEFDDLDPIYMGALPAKLISGGKLSRKDKIFMEAIIGYNKSSPDIAHLRYIRRHKSLKNTGAVGDFINYGLAPFLKSRGFKYLTSSPAHPKIAAKLPLGRPLVEYDPDMLKSLGFDLKKIVEYETFCKDNKVNFRGYMRIL